MNIIILHHSYSLVITIKVYPLLFYKSKSADYALLCFNLLKICVNISITSFSFMIISTRPYTPKNKIAEITSVIKTCRFNAVTQKDARDARIIARIIFKYLISLKAVFILFFYAIHCTTITANSASNVPIAAPLD